MLAFSIWNALWVVFVTFLFLSVLISLFSVVGDLFSDHDMKGGTKALWLFALLFFPIIGLLVYVIVRGDGMTKRAAKQQIDAKESFDSYVREVAGGPATEIAQAKALLDSGDIDDAEFAALKAKLLA